MSDSEELAKLDELRQRGVLSEEEFSRLKARLLAGGTAGESFRSAFGKLNGLRRSRHDRMFGGVCGGIASLTGTPAWLWRLVFFMSVWFVGLGFLVYLGMWICVPEEVKETASQAAPVQQ